MTRAFVLGNGISRQSVNLEQLKQLGTVYGCNALYREFTPDVLVATDKPIATQIQSTGYSLKNKFYTRRPTPGTGALQLPQQYQGYSSGPNAVGLAAIDGHIHIYLLGFDMGPTANNTINNLYAGTEFYKQADAPPTFTGNWTRQLCTICQDHPQVQFIRVCGETTAVIAEFNSICNLKNQTLDTFLLEINQ